MAAVTALRDAFDVRSANPTGEDATVVKLGITLARLGACRGNGALAARIEIIALVPSTMSRRNFPNPRIVLMDNNYPLWQQCVTIALVGVSSPYNHFRLRKMAGDI